MEEQVKNFVSFTGARPDQAKYYIIKAKGDLDIATNFYYDEILSKAAFEEEKNKPRVPCPISQPMDEERISENRPANFNNLTREGASRDLEPLENSRFVNNMADSSAMESSPPAGSQVRPLSLGTKNAFDAMNKGTVIFI
jgi:hypothetical protein